MGKGTNHHSLVPDAAKARLAMVKDKKSFVVTMRGITSLRHMERELQRGEGVGGA